LTGKLVAVARSREGSTREYVFCCSRLFEVDDNVVARWDWTARGRASGIEISLDVTSVNVIEKGKIVIVDSGTTLTTPPLSKQWASRSRRCRRRTWRSSRGGLTHTTDATLKRCGLCTILTWNWTGLRRRGYRQACTAGS